MKVVVLAGAVLAFGAVSGESLERLLAHREEWLAKAEAAKPALRHETVRARAVVSVERDPAAFQGWAARPVASADSVLNRPLRAGDSFVLDFGRHLVGRLGFRLVESRSVMDAPCRLKFTFAEVPSELGLDLRSWKGLCRAWFPDETLNFDSAPADYELPRRYAFRYEKVEVVACPNGVPAFASLTARTETSADESRLVPWQAPDAEAAAIDRIGCATLRDCMQTVFEDGPKRDRRLWLGDLRLEALANYATYRNYDVVRRSLYLLAGTAKDDGCVGTDAYEHPQPKPGACRFDDYTALFPTVVLEYLEASGDRETAEDLWPLCKRQIDLVWARVDASGVYRYSGEGIFIDHADKLDRQVPAQGAILFALKGLQKLAVRLGRAREVADLPAKIELMAAGARARYWDAARGVFRSPEEHSPSWLGQAWMVLAGVPSAAEARQCLTAVMGDRDALRPRTPYGHHYVVEALGVAGLREQADALLRSYWGGMVRKGADTFWEVWVPDDELASPYGSPLVNSYCHAWSAAPSYFLRQPETLKKENGAK